MIILVGLGVAAALVAGSYLVPLIITCVAAGVAIAVTFVATRAFYKEESSKVLELTQLKRSQIKKDSKARDEVSNLAREIGVDTQFFLNLSKAQRLELKRAISDFTQNIEASDKATKNLRHLAGSIKVVANDSSSQITRLNFELEKLKLELSKINFKLKSTEEALEQKEKVLNDTIERLMVTEAKLADDAEVNKETLATLTETTAKLNSAILHGESELSEKNAEILLLREKNTGLIKTIEELKTTVLTLKDKLLKMERKDHSQIREIEALITENTHLTHKIEVLTNTMESKNKKDKGDTFSMSNLRLFK